MNKGFWFIKQSLLLDYKFFRISKWNVSRKIEFIIKKYKSLFSNGFKKFELGKNSVNLQGKKIFYANKFGLSDYQGVLARHQNLLKIGGVKIGDKGVIIDIGANVGIFSMLSRDLYPQAIIYSIEPVVNTFECLKKNLANDSNIHIFNIALGNSKGKQRMSFSNQNSEISKIAVNGNVVVNIQSLDEFIRENNIKQIDLLKIDTEGFEHKVLLGAKNALAITRYIFIEITLENNSNYTLSSLMSLLYSKNYNFNLVSFRNFGDTSEGKAPILDCLLKNINLK